MIFELKINHCISLYHKSSIYVEEDQKKKNLKKEEKHFHVFKYEARLSMKKTKFFMWRFDLNQIRRAIKRFSSSVYK
jgi:hypothetical protein